MSAVDPLFAQWLMADADYVVRTDAGFAARWGASALTTERRTGLATRAGAEAEGDRQLAFFARGPFAVDIHQLAGIDWEDMRGQIVTLTVKQLDYDAGVDVFVLEASADRPTGMSQVTVLRPLGGV